jgi:hypothetical protein
VAKETGDFGECDAALAQLGRDRVPDDLGSLAVGGKLAQFPGGPLPNQNLVKVG